jgi:hypothetical protein
MPTMLPCLDPANPTPAAALLPADWLEEATYARFAGQGNIRHWIDELLAAGEPDDALRLIARVLPRKYALAWACEVLKGLIATGSGDSFEVERAGVALAERWLKDPSETNRRAALDFAERAAFKQPGAWLAAAAGWADGSLAPAGPEFTDVAPPDSLAGEAACAAILTAGWRAPAQRAALMQAAAVRALETFGSQERGL